MPAPDADCPVRHAVGVLGSKWALLVVRDLLQGPRRFNELLAGIDGISAKVLADRVRELEAAGVLRRTVFTEMPVRVVYELTPLGHELDPVVTALGSWGQQLLATEYAGRS
jgi:DNA-binding HxlR family transcriptional regulator